MINLNKLTHLLNFKSWPAPDWQWPLLQSHRGYWVGGARENTIQSLVEAKKQGYEMAEFDVRLSVDQVPMLYHDKDLKRLLGINLKASRLTARELAGWEIPTLAEVLKSKNRPRILNIEIKNDDRLDQLLEQSIIKVIKNTKTESEVMVSSFNPLSLRVFAKNLPQIPRALLIELDDWKKVSYWRIIGNLVAEAHMINWPHALLTEDVVHFLRENNIPVATWTVNDHKRARELFRWGVQSIITDRILPAHISDSQEVSL